MLYNPDWRKNISLADFICWLETKDPNEAYDYQNRKGDCCLGQYMKDRGVPWSFLRSPFDKDSGTYAQVSIALFGHELDNQHVLMAGQLYNNPSRTFGKALACAKKFQKDGVPAYVVEGNV